MKKLKITALEANTMKKNEMNAITGGKTGCNCACAFVDQGGSSSYGNGTTNANAGLDSKQPGTAYLPEVVIRPN